MLSDFAGEQTHTNSRLEIGARESRRAGRRKPSRPCRETRRTGPEGAPRAKQGRRDYPEGASPSKGFPRFHLPSTYQARNQVVRFSGPEPLPSSTRTP